MEFATENKKFAAKVERMLIDVVQYKTAKSFTGLGGMKRQLLAALVFEHFFLDMCTYGNKD